MNAVPFRAPSQIAQMGPAAADAKGLVSTEGAVGQQGLLVAPMSGKPCIAFEITVERKWEKSERTENGTQTKKGSSNLLSDYKGGVFALQDAPGHRARRRNVEARTPRSRSRTPAASTSASSASSRARSSSATSR